MAQNSSFSGKQLETVPCPLCGRFEAGPVAQRLDKLTIVRCTNCGMSFLNPRPLAEAIGRLYEQDYYGGAADKPIGYSDYSRSALQIKQLLPFGFDLVRQRLRPGMRTLDVGCAYGRWVYWMRKAGAIASGVDLSAEGVQWGRKHLKCDLVRGRLEDLPSGEGFDLITMVDLIEHVPDVGGLLANLRRLLKDGGLVFVQTPNWAIHRRYGPRTIWLHRGLEHLLYFEPPTLDRAFTQNGLEVLEAARPVAFIPCDIDDCDAAVAARQGPARRLIERLGGLELLRRVAGLLGRYRRIRHEYRFPSDPTEGAVLFGWYRKPA